MTAEGTVGAPTCSIRKKQQVPRGNVQIHAAKRGFSNAKKNILIFDRLRPGARFTNFTKFPIKILLTFY
jgi:hypothetical protein